MAENTASGATMKPAAPARLRKTQPGNGSLSSLEREFLAAWEVTRGQDRPVAQYKFSPGRRWRFDFAWPDCLIAVECEGGIYMRDRNKGHASPKELLASMEKNNAASCGAGEC